MLLLGYKVMLNFYQVKAIRISQFICNKVLHYWMDNYGVDHKKIGIKAFIHVGCSHF